MNRFYCKCGSEVFFDNRFCQNCGVALGFDSRTLEMVPIEPSGREQYKSLDLSARSFKLCANGSEFSSCNWLLPEDDENEFCFGCRFNRIIPNQKIIDVSPPANHQRWCRLEAAKKRLIYTLLELKIPISDGWTDAENGLLFDFMEDIESGSDVDSKKYRSVLKNKKKIKYLFCDLRHENQIIEMVKKAAKFFNGLDGVIFNAAATQESFVSKSKNNFPKFENYPLELWERSLVLKF